MSNAGAAAAAAMNADLFSGLTILFLVFVLVAALVLFFGWTCTSGTFKSNAFSVSNCFVVPGLFTSNVAVTAPALAPDAPCAEWNVFNCPSDRCQVDEVEGVCEDLGSPLMELDCGADKYQSAIDCPVVGCEWNVDEERCAAFGEHCAYIITKDKCDARQDCQWDRYRPGYAMCITTAKTLSPTDCRVIFNENECREDNECTWREVENEGSMCVNKVDITAEKCADEACSTILYIDGDDGCGGTSTNKSDCNASQCCGWVPNEQRCRRISPGVDC